ncbi:MAG: sortase [Actinomycetota bacterium]|nr:sortase [Actinomycetota bacterium]
MYEAHRPGDETPVPSAVVRRTIAAIGRTLVTLGLLILLFVSYELWGTGIFTARAQSNLKHKFAQELQKVHDDPTLSAPTTKTSPTTPGHPKPTTTVNPSTLVAPPEGEPIGKIDIPKINVHWVFVEGVQLTDLAKGPGHYPGTPLPGQIGNAAIAGHRTTHGAPFFDIDKLKTGDRINITTFAGTFVYALFKDPFPVQPTDYYVVDNTPDAELTLTSCHPQYSAAQRLIVKAKLVRNLSAKPVRPPTVVNGHKVKPPAKEQLATALRGQANSVVPSVAWGFVVAIIGAAWWFVFRRWRHPLTWLVGLVPFLPVLFVFYVYLERALPNGY